MTPEFEELLSRIEGADRARFGIGSQPPAIPRSVIILVLSWMTLDFSNRSKHGPPARSEP
jgi:hypothetical protein